MGRAKGGIVKRTSVGLAAVAASAVALGAVASTSVGGQQRQNEVKDLKIGLAAPLTGALESFGGIGVKAGNLAASQLNQYAKKGGLPLNVITAIQDTKTDKTAAQEAATKLITSDKVSCMAGPWASSEVIAVAENVSVDAGVPLISPSSTNPDVSKLADNGLVFRTAPSDALQGKVIAQVMGKTFGKTALVNTASRNDSYGISLVREFRKAWKAQGGRLGASVPYNPLATSLDTEAQKIVAGKPDAWMIVDFPADYPKMGKALVRTGKWSAAKTFSSDGLKDKDLPKNAGRKATEGMAGTVPTDRGAPGGALFQTLWDQTAQGPRGTYDDYHFDAVILCALAAVKANSTNPADIAKQIQAVSGPPGTKYTFVQLDQALKDLAAGKDIDYQGASGPIDLDANGDPTSASYGKWSYKGGKLVDDPKFLVKFGGK